MNHQIEVMGNDCPGCGRIYDYKGRELAPRSQWEERENYDDAHTIAEYHHGYDN